MNYTKISKTTVINCNVVEFDIYLDGFEQKERLFPADRFPEERKLTEATDPDEIPSQVLKKRFRFESFGFAEYPRFEIAITDTETNSVLILKASSITNLDCERLRVEYFLEKEDQAPHY